MNAIQKWVHKGSGVEVAQMGGFEVIYADNPWKYRNSGGRGAADKHYPTLSLAELCMLPVEDLAAPNCALFLWATWPTLLDAFAVMKAWGFEYYNCGFVWVKTNKLQQDTPFVAMGYQTRGNSEPCLLGVRGKPQRIDKSVQQIILDDTIVAPIGDEHSEKPAEARRRIERLYGDVPSLEMFSRVQAPGWELFGNDPRVNYTVTLEHR